MIQSTKNYEKWEFTYSSYKSVCREVVNILISNKLNFYKTYELKDREGRYVITRRTINGNPVTLINTYILPGSDFKYYEKMISIMVTETMGLLICGGDLNISLRPDLDKFSQRDTKLTHYIFLKTSDALRWSWIN